MIDLGKKNILGVLVNAIDYDAATERIITAAKNRQNYTTTCLAVHGVMTGVLDPIQRYRLNQFDLATPDGQPVRWALAWLHHIKLIDRVYGPTLMLKVCERAQQEALPIFLYGSRPVVIDALENNLKSRFPRLMIAGKEPSRFRRACPHEKQEIVQRIKNSQAALTFVGMGCPRQEVWIYEFKSELRMPLIAVGAAFDFHAGTLPQASTAFQKAGLEWLFRLYTEPKRLWKRYLLLNPLYLGGILLQKTSLRKFDPQRANKPADEIGYI
jgi:N-acetylglucosaminyldiphosphoundecaprenol N-acetyl-beta-D-mannosaminyltransferase